MVHLKDSIIYLNDGTIDVDAWTTRILGERVHPELKLIQSAILLAKLSGEEQATSTGESCLHQGLMMGEILANLNVDDETIAGAILYSSVRYADLNLDDIEENLNLSIGQLIRYTKEMDGISELYVNAISQKNQYPNVDNIRKMLLAMVNDIRAVLIKLAERLAVIRNIKHLDIKIQQRIASEIMEIYAPLANRLGMGTIKWELEDLAFRYLEPENYKKISSSLKSRRIDRDKYIQSFIEYLTNVVNETEIKQAQIAGRAKHIYSIYRKMKRKKVNIDEIYDALAVRILVPTIEDCYKTLSVVHAHWNHVSNEFDDYIAAPKANGYKSIHTAVIGPDHKYIEIQIRTFKMHDEAELGVAAHWIYKEGASASNSYEAKIAWLRQVMDWQQEVTSTTESKLDEAHKIFEDRVYVFTPENDIIDLPHGATPLDFAYNIHSELGHRCRGAKIDGDIVNLNYVLKNGNKVEILTTKQGQPSRDWLNPHLKYLKTSRAKAKVHAWFKRQNYEKNITDGELLLEKEFKRLAARNVNITQIANELNYKTPEDFYAAIGSGELKLATVANLIQKEQKPKPTQEELIKPTLASTRKATEIEIEGVGNLLSHPANCCHPIPGDEIIGYITQGKGVSIHKINCNNIIRAKSKNPEKLIEVSWGEKTLNKYPVDLVVIADDRSGLTKDIAQVITSENINMIGISVSVDRKTNLAYFNLTLEIDDIKTLDDLINKLTQLPNVVEARRSH